MKERKTIKQANKKYVKKEERDFLGFEIPDIKVNTRLASYESIKVRLTYPTNKSAYKQWIVSACYSSFATWDTFPNSNVDRIIRSGKAEERLLNMLKKRPISVANETPKFSFRIEGITRAMTHQIVRHRQMAFGQQSLRVSSPLQQPVRIPEGILANKKMAKKYKDTVHNSQKLYEELVNIGIPSEQARNILPIGTTTIINLTATLRDLIEYFRARISSIAQEEHTYIACLMGDELKRKQPKFYEYICEHVKGFDKLIEQYIMAFRK